MKQFKRIISLVIAMTMLVSMFSVGIVSTSAETATYILGDADNDGKVNIFDATYVQKAIAGIQGNEIAEGTIGFAAADVDRDGKINVFDVTLIQKYVAGYADAIALGLGETYTFGEDDPKPTEPQPTDPEVTEPEATEPEATEPEATEPEATEPEETEPEATVGEVTEGYYLVGKLNGVELWDAASLTADRKLVENPGAAGEYMLKWTFYGGDEIKVAHFDGTTLDKWYNDLENNYKIGETSDKIGPGTLYFNPNGNPDWSYEFLTVIADGNTPDPTTTPEPTTPDATTPDATDAPAGGPGYYLVGELNKVQLWSVDSNSGDRKLNGPDASGNYTLDWTFYMDDMIKVAYYDGTSITQWFKDGMDNHYTIGAEDKTGLCTITFNPNGGIGSYGFFTVQKKTVVDPTEPEATEPEATEPEATEPEATEPEATEPEATEPEATEPEATEPEETEPEVTLPVGYYMVGKFNGVECWSVDALTTDRLLSENPGAEGEYMLKWTFVGGDELKVAHFDGTQFDAWYNDLENNYKIGETSNKVGPGTLYFNPNGNPDWSYEFLTVIADEVVDPTEPEATEPEATEPEATEPEATEPEATEPEATEPEATEPEETEPEVTLPVGYYMVGKLNGVECWSVDTLTEDRLLSENPGAEGEYMLKWTFVGGDEIKVAHFDGTQFDAWYNDLENNYKIGETSNKVGPGTLYFNPNGNPDWSYEFLTVIADEVVDPTEPEATEPEATEPEATEPEATEPEATEPEATEPAGPVAGYYLVGKLNGVEYWGADTLSADRLLTNPDADGTYTLNWTFYIGDQIKVAYYDGTSITKWYKDNADNYNIGDASKAGARTLYFNPDKSVGSYGPLSVK